jgi:hypothetical protein
MTDKTITITIKCQFDDENNICSQAIHFDNDGMNTLEIIGLIEQFKQRFINDVEGDS